MKNTENKNKNENKKVCHGAIPSGNVKASCASLLKHRDPLYNEKGW